MTTFKKLFELFKVYPWDDFGATLLVLVFIGIIISVIEHKQTGIWLRKVMLTISSGFTGILLVLSIVTVVFCTFFFYKWILKVHMFSSMENYFITIFLMLSLSLLFGIISFFIHLSNLGAYKTDNINQHDLFSSSSDQKLNKIQSLQNESSLLKNMSKILEENISLEFLGYLKYSSSERIRDSINSNSFEDKEYMTKVYRINDLEVYYIEIKTLSSPRGGIHSSNYFLTDSEFVFLDNRILSMYPDIYFSLSDALSKRDKKPKELQKIVRIIKAQISHIDGILLPAHSELFRGGYIRINVFLYSFLLEVFGLSQNYITPLSRFAKANHLFFGLYRFLMQGTFIGLLISDIISK